MVEQGEREYEGKICLATKYLGIVLTHAHGSRIPRRDQHSQDHAAIECIILWYRRWALCFHDDICVKQQGWGSLVPLLEEAIFRSDASDSEDRPIAILTPSPPHIKTQETSWH